MKLNIDKKYILLVCMNLVLMGFLMVLGIIYTKSFRENKYLKEQIKDSYVERPINDTAAQSELQIMRDEVASQKNDKTAVTKVIEDFLTAYYTSDSADPFSRLFNAEKYLGDEALRTLCPYDNDPEEVTDDLIKAIRSHDTSLAEPGDGKRRARNYVSDLTIYYDKSDKGIETALAYFIVESGDSKSAYLFQCTMDQVGRAEDNPPIISDITMKTPVILPAYAPE